MSYATDSFDVEVVRLLKGGGAGFMPSDTIYGLSGRALDEAAVNRIHSLKERSGNKPFIILISNYKMLDLLSIDKRAVAEAEKFWPGALTVVAPAPNSPPWLRLGLQTLAIRMPADLKLRKLIDITGPLISTSANLPGRTPSQTAAEAKEIFGDKLDFYVDIGAIDSQPSTIVKATGGKLEVIRQGAVKIV